VAAYRVALEVFVATKADRYEASPGDERVDPPNSYNVQECGPLLAGKLAKCWTADRLIANVPGQA
jgi:hypothetical protein